MPKDDVVYLHHIADAIARIETYIDEMSKEQFLANHLVQDAVVRQLEIIGEASRNLSEGYLESHPEIAWSQIIAFRNRIVHGYFDVNLEIVWTIVQNDLPPLENHVREIIGG